MTSATARALIALAVAAIAALAARPAAADPMRPLALSGGPIAANGAVAVAVAGAASAGHAAARAEGPAAPVLNPQQPADRLVAIRHDDGRGWQALVGERWLAAGDRLGGQTVSAIDGNGLQMADSRGNRTWHRLLPALQGTVSQPTPVATSTPAQAPQHNQPRLAQAQAQTQMQMQAQTQARPGSLPAPDETPR